MGDLRKTVELARNAGPEALCELVKRLLPTTIVENYDMLVSYGADIDLAQVVRQIARCRFAEPPYIKWFTDHGQSVQPILKQAGSDWVYSHLDGLLEWGVSAADIANTLQPWQLNCQIDTLRSLGLQLADLQHVDTTSIPALVKAGYPLEEVIDRIAWINMTSASDRADVNTAIYLASRCATPNNVVEHLTVYNDGSYSIGLSPADGRPFINSVAAARRLAELGADIEVIIRHCDALTAAAAFGDSDELDIQLALADKANRCGSRFVYYHLAELLDYGLIGALLLDGLKHYGICDKLDLLTQDKYDIDGETIFQKLDVNDIEEVIEYYTPLTNHGARIDLSKCLCDYLRHHADGCEIVTASELYHLCADAEKALNGEHLNLANLEDKPVRCLVDCDYNTVNFLVSRSVSPHAAIRLVDPWTVIENSHRLEESFGITPPEIEHAIDDWMDERTRKQPRNTPRMIGSNELKVLLDTDPEVDLSSLSDYDLNIDDIVANYGELQCRGVSLETLDCHYSGRIDDQLLLQRLPQLIKDGAPIPWIVSMISHSWIICQLDDDAIASLIQACGADKNSLTKLSTAIDQSNDDWQIQLLAAGADPQVVLSQLKRPDLFIDQLQKSGVDVAELWRRVMSSAFID